MPTYTVPYSALATEAALVKAELMQAVENVLDSGRYIMGPEMTAFEREFAEYCQTKFAAGVANGTCALHLVLRGLGLAEGDEVITAPNSFVASASSIALAVYWLAGPRRSFRGPPQILRPAACAKGV